MLRASRRRHRFALRRSHMWETAWESDFTFSIKNQYTYARLFAYRRQRDLAHVLRIYLFASDRSNDRAVKCALSDQRLGCVYKLENVSEWHSWTAIFAMCTNCFVLSFAICLTFLFMLAKHLHSARLIYAMIHSNNIPRLPGAYFNANLDFAYIKLQIYLYMHKYDSFRVRIILSAFT